jgi:hypothetical protein
VSLAPPPTALARTVIAVSLALPPAVLGETVIND